MMIPLRDENPTVRMPIATLLLVGLNILIAIATVNSIAFAKYLVSTRQEDILYDGLTEDLHDKQGKHRATECYVSY